MKVVCLLLVTAALCFVKTNALSVDFLETLMAAENTLEKRGKGKESAESSEEGTKGGKDESDKPRKGGFVRPLRPACKIDEDCKEFEKRMGRTLVCNPDKKYCLPVDEPSKKKGPFRPPACKIDEDCKEFAKRVGRTLICNPDKKYCQLADRPSKEKRGKGKESGESSEEGPSGGKDESDKPRKGGFKVRRRPPGCDVDEDCEKYEKRAGRALVCNPYKKYCQPVDEPSKKKGPFRPPGCDIDEDCEKYEKRAGRALVCNPYKKYCQPVDEPDKEKEAFSPIPPPACKIDEDCQAFAKLLGRDLVCNTDEKYCQLVDEPDKGQLEVGPSGGMPKSKKRRVLGSLIERLTEMLEE